MFTNFDIDALRTMVSGTTHGSFSRAAAEVGRSQSAVSMQLKKLEKRAGVPLFVRKGRGLVTTEAGEVLLQYARQIIKLNDEAARALGAVAAAETVRVGLPQDFFDNVLPATLHEFARICPEAQVSVQAGSNHALYEDVKNARLDAAIAFFPEGSDAKGELLCRMPLYWIAYREHPEPAAGTKLPLVLFDHRCLFRQAALESLDKSGLQWRIVLTTPSLAAIWSALRSSFGIGVRVGHALPDDMRLVSDWSCLPSLPQIELRLLVSDAATPTAQKMVDVLKDQTLKAIVSEAPKK